MNEKHFQLYKKLFRQPEKTDLLNYLKTTWKGQILDFLSLEKVRFWESWSKYLKYPFVKYESLVLISLFWLSIAGYCGIQYSQATPTASPNTFQTGKAAVTRSVNVSLKGQYCTNQIKFSKTYPLFLSFCYLSYRTTSVRAPSLISMPFWIVRTPYTRIIRPYYLFECFLVGKDSLSVS